MAERRMFAKTIIDSDAFLDMPLSTQALYFHLGMRADDDGFVNGPKKVQRMVGASEDDLKLLIAKRFILTFDSGVIVIKHWKMHNYIQKDRYKPTVYLEERATLELQKNGSYTECIHDGYNMDTQVSIGKDSIGKDSIGKDNIIMANQPVDNSSADGFIKPNINDVRDYAIEIAIQTNLPCIDVNKWYAYYEKNNWMCMNRNGDMEPMKDWRRSVQTWYANEKKKIKQDAVNKAADQQRRKESAEAIRNKLKEQGIELYSSPDIEV